MSWDTNGKGFNKIRWDRVFTTVSGEGQPRPTFNILIALSCILLVSILEKEKKKKHLFKVSGLKLYINLNLKQKTKL
jgi:signal peptidase I